MASSDERFIAQEEQLNQIVGVTGCSLDQAKFYLESANGDVAVSGVPRLYIPGID